MLKYTIAMLIIGVLGIGFYQPQKSLAQSCSTGNNVETQIVFENYLDETVYVYWVGFDCQEVSYGEILPTQTTTMNTYDGHEWILRDESGEELARGVASSQTMIKMTLGEPITITDPLDFTYRPDKDWEWVVIAGYEGCEVRPTTPQDGFDPFYEKMCDYMGIPIISSNNVPDEALQMAWNIMANMLQGQSQVLEKMLEFEIKMGIVAQSEGITMLPEYAFLRNDPVTNWDERARGLGGSPSVPLGSGAEENLLCYFDDPYYGESIFLHEFAHTMKDSGIIYVDPTFNLALNLAYQQAIEGGLWENTYAMETVEEYWAEGVQDYFNTNIEAIPTNGIHNFVNTREELADYDPTLFAIIDRIFGGFEWTPTCP
ncbi:MAG: hypothetical protein MUE54_14065 [Anaerolineae bacterium]|nr:hypothetical protein [Anaerolineae bacterium]